MLHFDGCPIEVAIPPGFAWRDENGVKREGSPSGTPCSTMLNLKIIVKHFVYLVIVYHRCPTMDLNSRSRFPRVGAFPDLFLRCTAKSLMAKSWI